MNLLTPTISFVVVCLINADCWTQTVPLYYDPLTGNLTMDASVSPDGTFSGYAIAAPGGGFVAENFTPFMGSVYTTATSNAIGEHDLTGFTAAVYSLGAVMPANLTDDGLSPYRAGRGNGYGLLTKWGGGEILDFEWNYGPSPFIPVNQGVNGPPTPERWAEHARLLYSELDGSLYLDSRGDRGGWLAMYYIQLEDGEEFQIDQFNSAADGFTVATLDSLTEIATGGIPEGRYNLGAVLPAGLSEEELISRIHSAAFIGLPGHTGGTLDIGANGQGLALDYVPDPGGVFEPCDFDKNGFCDVADLNSLVEHISSGSGDLTFDVTQDGQVTAEDISNWLGQASDLDDREYRFGDINLDGRVSAHDLNVVSIRWQQSAAVWTDGDLNGDSFVDAHDLNAVGKNWTPLAATASPVPEPDSLWLVVSAAVLLGTQSLGFACRR